jgi:hypothetical protein
MDGRSAGFDRQLNSFEGERTVFSREWKERIPRDFN